MEAYVEVIGSIRNRSVYLLYEYIYLVPCNEETVLYTLKYGRMILIYPSRHPCAERRFARCAGRRDRCPARGQWCGQDHDAKGDLEPAACRARRRHQGLDSVRRRRSAGPVRRRTATSAQPRRRHPRRAAAGRRRPAIGLHRVLHRV